LKSANNPNRRNEIPPFPTVRELKAAHKEFLEYEPRQIFYDIPTPMVRDALLNFNVAHLADALNVLLFTWNHYYFVKHPWSPHYIGSLKDLLRIQKNQIRNYSGKKIEELPTDFEGSSEASGIENIFTEFNRVVGRVGAAKALHLLAPDLFPLWDNRIAKNYKLWNLSPKDYRKFICYRQTQCSRLRGTVGNPLKFLDEWDYMRVAKSRPGTDPLA
jgi:hypothetical protein